MISFLAVASGWCAEGFSPATDVITSEEEYFEGLTTFEQVVYWIGRRDGSAFWVTFDTNEKRLTSAATSDRVPRAASLHSGRRLTCLDSALAATVDCISRDIVLQGDTIVAVTDVNGDGIDDVVSPIQLYLSQVEGYGDPIPYPEAQSAESFVWRFPLQDVHNDGNDDLALHSFIPSNFYRYEGSRIEIFAGGLNGYAALPERTIDFDGPMVSMVALQADTDPERELLLVLGDYVQDASYFTDNMRMVLVDLPPGGEATIRPVGAPMISSSGVGKLIPFEDIDGDGLDEVVLLGAVTDGPVATTLDDYRPLRVLTPANDFDPFEPLLLLDPDLYFTISGEHAVITDDINQDGRRDITMATPHSSYNPYLTTVQVWYAPWFEPDPVVEDTAPPTDTSTTGDTATPPTPKSTTSPPKEVCGCTSGVSTPWFPLFIRQRSNVSGGRQ